MLRHILHGMSIGSRIRDARERAEPKITQHKLAEACGVRHLAISQWERDKTVPRADQLATIAEACAVDPGWLLTGAGSMNANEPEAAA